MATVFLFLNAIGGAAGAVSQPRAESYLLRVADALELSRGDLPAMLPVAEEAAARLANGGKLWAAGNRSLVSEVTSRAGGIMMIRDLGDAPVASNDIVLHFPDSAGATSKDWSGFVVTFGGNADVPRCFAGHADMARISPSLAAAVSAWVFTGELVAALTRLGKMPVIYESIGAYGGNDRIRQFKDGEIAFHDKMAVPPIAAGVLGNRYIDTVAAMLRRVEKEQRQNLDSAGKWTREAKAEAKQLLMYTMGHLVPDEVATTEIGRVFRSGMWNAGFRSSPKPNDMFGPGDVIAHIGYHHPPDDLLRRARTGGARVVYVSVRADRDFTKDRGVMWIDPMWDWPDACVPLDGYDVPLLPASGVVNGAIAWEIHRLTTTERPHAATSGPSSQVRPR